MDILGNNCSSSEESKSVDSADDASIRSHSTGFLMSPKVAHEVRDEKKRLKSISKSSSKIIARHSVMVQNSFEQFYRLGKKIGEGCHS